MARYGRMKSKLPLLIVFGLMVGGCADKNTSAEMTPQEAAAADSIKAAEAKAAREEEIKSKGRVPLDLTVYDGASSGIGYNVTIISFRPPENPDYVCYSRVGSDAGLSCIPAPLTAAQNPATQPTARVVAPAPGG